MIEATRIRDEFVLDPDVVFLNHGSFGACPREVLARYQEWQLELERQPVLFLARRVEGLLAAARAALGDYVGADPDDLVFVQNATAAVNASAGALELRPGDEVLSTSLEYGALDRTWEHVCAQASARYVRVPVTLPVGNDADVVDEIWQGVTDRTRALYLSHITSETALRLPIEELCARARECGLRTIVDGAHVPGHIPLDLRVLDVDFYAGNCHKWVCAPKGSAFLYVRRELQDDVHPLAISWGYADDEPTFVSRHQKQGTRDPSAYLTVPMAIEWQRAHDWDTVAARCRGLAAAAPERLGLAPTGPGGLQMVSMLLPESAPADLQQRLYDEFAIEVPVFDRGTRVIRASFQGYNDESDLEALADALDRLL